MVTLIVVCIWSLASNMGVGGIFAIDSVYPGLLCSALLYFSISFLRPTETDEQEKIDYFISLVAQTDASKET